MTTSTELISQKEESTSSTTTRSDINFNLLISIKNIYSVFLLFSNITKILILSFIIFLYFLCIFLFNLFIISKKINFFFIKILLRLLLN